MVTLFHNTKTAGFSTYLAIGSFVMGTTLFLLHFVLPKFPKYGLFYFIGYIFVLLAILINGIVFLNLLFQFIMKPHERESLAIKMLIMLANIPVAVLYFYIVINNLQ